MKKEKFSVIAFSGVKISGSLQLKSIDVIDGDTIATVIDADGDEWRCKASEGPVSWEDGNWISFE